MDAFCLPAVSPSLPLLILISMMVASVLTVGFTSAVILAKEYLRTSNLRYRGTCTISTTKDMDYLVVGDLPPDVPWFGVPTLQMKLFSSPSELIDAKIIYLLLEDMDIEDTMETITVRDGLRAFQVVHDFNDNLTTIKLDDRCFVMDMIHDFVLDPDTLIASFHNESKLDLSHAHSTFRADLPAMPMAMTSSSYRSCSKSNKPTYRLNLEDSLVVRKRSITIRSTLPPAEAGAASAAPLATNDFVQFSGKHLHRMTIANLDAVLRHEAARPAPPAPPAPPSPAPRDR